MPYDLSACGLVTVSTSRFVACALGSHIFGNPNVSDDGTVIIGTVVNGTALSLTDGNAAHTYFKFNVACGSVIQSDSRLTFMTSASPNAMILTGGNASIGTNTPNIAGFTGTILTINGTGNYQGFEIGTSGTTRMTMVSNGTDGYISTRQTGMNIIFEAGAASEKMRITSTGNVGIGETPASSIGWARILTLNGGNVGDTAYILKKTSSAQEIAFGTDGAALYIDVAGNATATNNTIKFRTSNTNSCYSVTERMRITSAGNVGIGTGIPDAKLHICNAVAGNTDNFLIIVQNCCTVSGARAGIAFSNNDQTPSAGGLSGASIQTSNNGIDGTGNLLFGTLLSGTNTERMRITYNGNVGINCSAPSYKLHVNGTFYAAGSSQDYKQSICNYNTDSCMFMKLKPVTYQYKEEYCHLGKELKSGTQIGLIAEEVAESHPELAILVNEENEKVVRNVDYEKLTIILLSELQKLRQEVDQLKNK